jgi:aerobic-type carbon monoxide dehydrogenase small subunit (CoxS/CutS family)
MSASHWRFPVKATIRLIVNGTEKTITTDRQRPLLDVLREELQLTGPKYGCGESQCSACLVHLDGKPTRTCTLPVGTANGKTVTTIEGLASGDTLHPVQEAFLEQNAMQCGYCTGGMIMSAVALLEENPNPTEEEIKVGMNRHMCRCNGYVKVIDAVRLAAQKMGGR